MSTPKKLILTERQKLFCEEWVVDRNGTQAAIRAGFSFKCAKEIAHRLLTKAHIRTYIDQLIEKRAKRTEVTSDRIIKELAKLAFFNSHDTLDEFGETLPIADWSRDDAACIQEITTTTSGIGRYKETTVKLKLSDKKASLDLLGRHKKLFTDKVEHSGDMEVTFNLDYGVKSNDAG